MPLRGTNNRVENAPAAIFRDSYAKRVRDDHGTRWTQVPDAPNGAVVLDARCEAGAPYGVVVPVAGVVPDVPVAGVVPVAVVVPDVPVAGVVPAVPDDPPVPFPELDVVEPLPPLAGPVPAAVEELGEGCRTAFMRSVTTIGSLVPSRFLAGA